MIKNTWYSQRKKLVLEKGYFYWIVIGVFLYVLVSSLIFLLQYLIKEKWDHLVDSNETILGVKWLTHQQRENWLKVIYLTRFAGTIAILILYQFTSYLYFKKIKYGYGFVLFWFAISIGLVIIDSALIKSDPLLMVWKLFPAIILGIVNIVIFINLYQYRQRIKQQFYLKIKKGEL